MLTPLTCRHMLTLSTHIPRMARRGAPAAPIHDADERPYHHGDLRAALVRSAIGLLRDAGPEALTLRGVARAAGVSQAAPYRHFADRRALVAAVAEDGFERLGAAMRRAMEGDGPGEGTAGRPGLKAVAVAYVRFAHAHPAEYRIMFGPEVARQDDLPELQTTSHAVLDFVRQGIERLQAAGLVTAGDAGALAVATWSMLHGLVMLSLDGQTAGVAPSLDQLVETTTQLMMFGMAPRG
jgi:AcrR family transcriptional regulator